MRTIEIGPLSDKASPQVTIERTGVLVLNVMMSAETQLELIEMKSSSARRGADQQTAAQPDAIWRS